jgi:hypothetical protein
VAFEGDRAERKVAAFAASAIVLTGLLGLFYLMPFGWRASPSDGTILARNIALVLLLIVWFRAAAPNSPGSALVADTGVDARFPSGGGDGSEALTPAVRRQCSRGHARRPVGGARWRS